MQVSDWVLLDPATIQQGKKIIKIGNRWYMMKSGIIARKYAIYVSFALQQL